MPSKNIEGSIYSDSEASKVFIETKPNGCKNITKVDALRNDLLEKIKASETHSINKQKSSYYKETEFGSDNKSTQASSLSMLKKQNDPQKNIDFENVKANLNDTSFAN